MGIEPKILVVDRNPAARLVVARLLGSVGYTVHEAAAADQALLLFDQHQPQLVLLNPLIATEPVSRMVVRWVHQQPPAVPVVLMVTRNLESEWRHQLEADDWIQLPVVFDHLMSTIQRFI